MNYKMAWLASAVTAVVVSAGTALVTAGSAAAAPPDCTAPSDIWYKACVAVSYQTSHVKSIRVDGRCLYGPGYHPTVIVDNVADVHPNLLTYGGAKCESNTRNSARVSWAGNADKDQYRWVWIS